MVLVPSVGLVLSRFCSDVPMFRQRLGHVLFAGHGYVARPAPAAPRCGSFSLWQHDPPDDAHC